MGPAGGSGGYKGGGNGIGSGGTGGTSGGGGGASGNGNQRTPVQNVSEFEMECGDVNALDEHESETYACHNISKGNLAKFKMCMIEALIAKGVEVNDNCLKNFAKEKYGITEEEWMLLENNLTDEEKEWLKLNPWAYPHLLKYLENCGKNSDPGRPDLGILGNKIRSFLNSEEEKDYFDRYWLGQGNKTLSQLEFDDIINDLISSGNGEWSNKGMVTFNGAPATHWLVNLKNTSKYYLAFLHCNIYQNQNGNFIGFTDTYNFDAHSGKFIWLDLGGSPMQSFAISYLAMQGKTIAGCTDRSFFNEWATRATAAASVLCSSCQDYEIRFP